MPDEDTQQQTQTDGGQPTATATATERPAGLPENFKTVEALANSFAEAQRKITALSAPKPKLAIDDTTPVPPPVDDEAGLQGIVESAGLKWDEVVQTVGRDGKPTPEQYTALKAKGFGKKVVDETIATYIAIGQKAADDAQAACTEVAGGEQQLTTLLAFGRTLAKPVIDDLNRRLSNPTLAAGAVRELMGHYDASVTGGKAKPLMEGRASAGTVNGYTTQADFYRGAQEAKTSSAARAKHLERVRASETIDRLPMK